MSMHRFLPATYHVVTAEGVDAYELSVFISIVMLLRQ